jgi:hypothetical protein
MKGTILDFLKLASEKPQLAKELVELAAKHGLEFSDEVSDEELEKVAGGLMALSVQSKEAGDGLKPSQGAAPWIPGGAAIFASISRAGQAKDTVGGTPQQSSDG